MTLAAHYDIFFFCCITATLSVFLHKTFIIYTVSEKIDSTAIYIDEYDYALPDARIAKYPLPKRDTSKLLLYANGEISTYEFSNIAELLPQQALLVYNNTRVIQARMEFFKSTGGRIEVFCLEPFIPADYAQSLGSTGECIWKCMVGNLKKWKNEPLHKTLFINGIEATLSVELLNTEANIHTVKFSWNSAEIHFADILESAGELPIPPYLHRKTEPSDITAYQTVYSKIKGSVAAPTAGLHFTPEVFEQLKAKKIELEELTLHVGAGTFQPVKTRDVAEHVMHTEVISVNLSTIQQLIKKIDNIVAVGTTSVRTLESLYYIGLQLESNNSSNEVFSVQQWEPYTSEVRISSQKALQNIEQYLLQNKLTALHAETQIMIKPGYEFKLVRGIITNFHQPKSTLLLLVSAFVKGNWQKIYNYALANDYRFLSYGDSSLLLRD